MKKIIGFVSVLLLLAPSISFAGPKLYELAAKNKGKTLAIVSIAVNNFGNSLQGWNSTFASELMASRVNTMLDTTESILAADWTVVKASTLVTNKDFMALAKPRLEVALAQFEKEDLPLFCKDRPQLIKATTDKDLAQKIASALGLDYIMIIYAEWGVKTGTMIPTSKALSKNVVSVLDAQGATVFEGRSDDLGAKSLGANGYVTVNEGTIDQWVDAYARGITKLLKEGRK